MYADLSNIGFHDFKDLVNKIFRIRFHEEVIFDAELIDAQMYVPRNETNRGSFSLIFRTQQKNEYFNQGICTLEHPNKGHLQLFIVPIGTDNHGMKYEVIFS
jgi:hypothetical protein